ncbi:hypothetical protein H8959_005900 [Pygathrix nigripes]
MVSTPEIVPCVASEREFWAQTSQIRTTPRGLHGFELDPAWRDFLEEGKWAVGAGKQVRGARLRGFFCSNQTHSLQSVFSRSVEHIFLLILFGEGVRNVLRPEPGAGRVLAPVNRVGQRAARCPEDPASAPFGGSGPSALAGKRRRLILPGVRLASPCARARQTPLVRRVPRRADASTAPPAGALPSPHPHPAAQD